MLVDSRLEVSLDAHILTPDSGDFAKPVLVFCAVDDRERRHALEARGAEVVVLPNPHGKVELRQMLAELGSAASTNSMSKPDSSSMAR